MKRGFFIAPGPKRINPVLLAAITLVLAGCSHPSEPQFSLAPPPPAFDPHASSAQKVEPPRLMAFTGHVIPFPSNIALSTSGLPSQDTPTASSRKALTATSFDASKCSIKDRFDRDALVAYQWGQNRLALRVKGINMESEGIEEIKFEYKLKLQPHKSRKEKCRYDSHWQGLIGSGYNEMFLRQENTVWDQIEEISDDAEDAFDKLF